jgi:copper chaperone CopZ
MVGEDEQVVELKVSGMRCNGCVQSLQRALSEVSGVTEADVRLEEGLARVRGSGFTNDALYEAVDSLGFTVEG